MTGRRGEDSLAVVLQMVQQNDEKHEAGHARLRGDWRGHDQRLLSMEAAISDLRVKVERVQDRPTDISTATLPAKLVVAVVAGAVSIAGAIWYTGSRVNDLSTQFVNRAKLEDERNDAYKASIEDLKRELKLYEIKTDELKDAMLKKGVIR